MKVRPCRQECRRRPSSWAELERKPVTGTKRAKDQRQDIDKKLPEKHHSRSGAASAPDHSTARTKLALAVARFHVVSLARDSASPVQQPRKRKLILDWTTLKSSGKDTAATCEI